MLGLSLSIVVFSLLLSLHCLYVLPFHMLGESPRVHIRTVSGLSGARKRLTWITYRSWELNEHFFGNGHFLEEQMHAPLSIVDQLETVTS
jgi:hypothetical protein